MDLSTFEAVIAATLILSTFQIALLLDRRQRRQRQRLETLAWAYGLRPLARETNDEIFERINDCRALAGYPPLVKKR